MDSPGISHQGHWITSSMASSTNSKAASLVISSVTCSWKGKLGTVRCGEMTCTQQCDNNVHMQLHIFISNYLSFHLSIYFSIYISVYLSFYLMYPDLRHGPRVFKRTAALQRRLDRIRRDDGTILQLTHQDVAQHPGKPVGKPVAENVEHAL